MERIKIVLAVLAVMAMIVASAVPAVAADKNSGGDSGGNKGGGGITNNGGTTHNNNVDVERGNDHDFDIDHDDFKFDHDDNNIRFFNVFDDNDCDWDYEEGWFFIDGNWQWGKWVLDC